MEVFKKIVQWAVAMSLIIATSYYFLHKNGKNQTTQQMGIPTVTIAKPVLQEITEWDEYTGRFEATEQIEVRARVGGYLESVHFKDGSLVKKGDLLFVIDPRPYAAALNQALADVTVAETKLDYATKEFNRNANLVKSGSISQGTFDEKKQQQRQTTAEVEAAKAAAERARLELEFTQVKSPVNGRISRKLISEGNLITGGNAESTLLTTIVSLDPIYFYFDVDEQNFLKYARLYQKGTGLNTRADNPVFVALMDEKNFAHRGHSDFVDNRIDTSTGTLRARAIFENPDLLLLPGLFGRIQIMGTSTHQGILIPDEAVLTDLSRKYVYIVDQNGKVSTKDITLGPIIDNLRVVHSGLQGDEWIVIKGIQRAKDKGTVNVQRTIVATTKTPEAEKNSTSKPNIKENKIK